MVDFFYYYGVNITDIYVPATVALVSYSGTGYTYAEAYSVMKSKYGLTLHMTGFDIPVESESEPITLPYYKILNDGTIQITGCDESATEVIIPSEIDGAKVTRSGESAFAAYKNLKSINIPDSVTNIGNGAFASCTSLTSINVSENNQNYMSVDGVLFNKNMSRIIMYPIGKEDLLYIISNNVTSIGGNAFKYCNNITEITISNSLMSIYYEAFNLYKNLK